MIALPFAIFLFGLFIGSFLNVVIIRLNTGKRFVRGRSMCMRCGKELAWFELLPVLSFLVLRGKCRTCKKDISFQYPIVELITALVFTLLYIKLPLANGFSALSWIGFGYALVVSSLLMVIAVYDLRHKIIPDSVVYPFILLSLAPLAYHALTDPSFLLLPAIASGAMVALPFFLLWFFSRGAWMGFGDVKLALGIGWLLGVSGGFAAVLLSFWIGGVFGLFLIGLNRTYTIKSQVPFAPFLIAGACIAGAWGVTIGTLLSL